jgi:phosphoglycerol transferase MdoB-like AlkP superfamily enzyme
MTTYFKIIRLFGKRILVVLAIYQICRLLFLYFNRTAFSNITLKLLYGGLIYDLSAVGFINLLFGFLFLLPFRFIYNIAYQKVIKILFFIINLLFIASNFVDFEYYKFTGRRSSFDLITARGMEHEITRLIPTFLVQFWYLPILLFIFALFFWKLLTTEIITSTVEKRRKPTIVKQSLLFLGVLTILLIFGRGGFQSKPLRIVDAIEYSNLGNSALALNTPFCILKTVGRKETLVDPNYFSKSELKSIFDPEFRSNPHAEPLKKNVVIVILESFGDENVQKGYTPFLDSLITKSYYFKNGFANGKVSIDAVPSIMSSIPSLMNKSLIASEYSLNKVYSLPKIFRKQGYKSSFFHGAFNGSQNFDQYCKVAGFDAYYGKDQYPKEGNFDGRWGIYDEPFLQFFCDEISTFKQPFFTTVFTISSHQPFNIPKEYKGRFPKGTSPIHESIGYTDHSLRKFFEKAKKQDWYKNTLFVFSADHTAAYGEGIYKTNVGKFQIPIFFLDTSNPDFRGVVEKNFQQTDILPSLLDYLNIKDDVVTYGKSFRSEKNFVVNYLDNVYNYVQDDYYLAFDGQKTIGLYNFKKDPYLKNNLMKKENDILLKMEKFIKAYIQSFNARQIKNELTIK